MFGKLFGKKAAAPKEAAAIEYQGYRIIPTPMREGKDYRLAARIEKDVDGETKVHQLIRADTLQSEDEAAKVAIDKAKQMIDQQARWLFD